MSTIELAHHVATSVLRPHLGHEIARERAAQIVTCFDPDALPDDADVRHAIAGARERIYGGRDLSDDEIERLTQGVLLALGSVR